MPIKGLSEQLRMPRIGKIHLGVKVTNAKGVEYPSATDYFVCPEAVTKVYGEQPKELPVMIPVEDEEYWASQYYRRYSQTRGLICKGDGENCMRMVDTSTGDFAGKDTKGVAWKDAVCEGKECPHYKDNQCSEMMCLQFMLPEVPGVGIWQIDTGSINSIRNINSATALIRSLCGRIKMIPLLLVLEKQEVTAEGKKKNVHVMNLRQRETLMQLIADSQRPIHELLAPVVDESEVARDIEAIWPQETPPEPEPEPPPDELNAKLSPTEGKPDVIPSLEGTGYGPLSEDGLLNFDWFKEQVLALQKKQVLGWDSDNVLAWLNEITGGKATKPSEAVALLDEVNSAKVVEMVKKAREKLS